MMIKSAGNTYDCRALSPQFVLTMNHEEIFFIHSYYPGILIPVIRIMFNGEYLIKLHQLLIV